MRCCTSVIKCRKDTRRSLLFDEIADNFVVEIFDGCPFYLLPHIFFLLRFEGKLDENLLQFLVHIVNAQLLEGVVL